MFNLNDHLMDLKGKKYLQVMWRLVWFREDHPDWCIDTHLEQLSENHAVFAAKILDENGMQKASGYGSESMKDFRDFIEKAETKAIGRALAMLGYGTQFAPELDEGKRIVDSPVEVEVICEACGQKITPTVVKGKPWSVQDVVNNSRKCFPGKCMCYSCQKAEYAKMKEQANEA